MLCKIDTTHVSTSDEQTPSSLCYESVGAQYLIVFIHPAVMSAKDPEFTLTNLRAISGGRSRMKVIAIPFSLESACYVRPFRPASKLTICFYQTWGTIELDRR